MPHEMLGESANRALRAPARARRRPPKPLSRRAANLLIAGTVLALPLGPRPAVALDAQDASRLVDSLVSDINAVINSGQPEGEMLRQFEGLFVRYGDVPTVARFTLGADARRASSAQLSAYTRAYQGYVARKYGRRFREFIGGELEVTGVRQVPRNRRTDYEVRAVARLRGEDPIEVSFFVSDASGQDKFYNMFVEGVNMLLSERTEIGALLDQRGGNIDALIRDLPAL